MRPRDPAPGPFTWLVAFISFLLPWFAAVVALFGLWDVARGDRTGWWYVAAGAALLISDVVIDLVWAYSGVLKTDQPELNLRSSQLIGRVAVVEDGIAHGRGRVRIDDMIWTAEGPDTPAGVRVRVTAANGTTLRVERA